MSRKIVAGQFISQRELIEIIGLPMAAIRALIPRLEAEGLIVTVPQRGLQIAHVDVNLIHNAFQFRLMLESYAMAAFVRDAPDEEIAKLREAHEIVLRQGESEVTPELLRQAQLTDWNFHDRIIDWLANDLVSAAYRTNSIKIRLIRQGEVRIAPQRLLIVMRIHLDIIERMEKRDVESAVQALTEHIMAARNRAMNV
ncbi:GntR family transcriptional regulator [Bosea sp. NBC_00550]|uniref:GntR family transcriptional regulator n=1 Tax=Bosea sp. NBC_00550 TaxID=2969621 RepID=UPI0022319BA7|nr:GntR family transcriptional regulator [Bosea sp. NBC_00550]UZF95796.1 GntR family transcriptional regulator [Bosea sp. NBC_00550]